MKNIYETILKEIQTQANYGTLDISEGNDIILTKGIMHELKMANSGWISVEDKLPEPGVRVIIFTKDHDFSGERYFDVESNTLNECFYTDPDDQPGICRFATHWTYRPFD